MRSLLPHVSRKTILEQARIKKHVHFFSILSSVEPVDDSSTTSYYERPGTLVYAESSFYRQTNNSWINYFEKEIPRRGIHFVQISVFDDVHISNDEHGDNPYTYLKHAEIQLAKDLSKFPGTVLVTRGGLLSMMAQFYLESLALSGLVMIDPYVLPEVASSSAPFCRTSTSCKKLLLEISELEKQQNSQQQKLQDNNTELRLLKSLSLSDSSGKNIRLLKLEPSSVPMLLVYPSSCASVNGDTIWNKQCVQAIADYHSNMENIVDIQRLQQQDHKAFDALDGIVSWLDDKVM